MLRCSGRHADRQRAVGLKSFTRRQLYKSGKLDVAHYSSSTSQSLTTTTSNPLRPSFKAPLSSPSVYQLDHLRKLATAKMSASKKRILRVGPHLRLHHEATPTNMMHRSTENA